MTARTVFMASDFSARCDRPLDRAAQLARGWCGRLIVAHILEKPAGGALAPDLEAVRHALQAELPAAAHGAEIMVRVGSAPHSLAVMAKERDADIVVTGVARYNSLGDYLLGTAVDYIIRYSEIPVLVVRQRPSEPYRRLVVATDYSDGSMWSLLTAAKLFPDIPIIVVHAWHVPFEGFVNADAARADVAAREAAGMTKFLESPLLSADIRARISAVNEEGEINQVIARHHHTPSTDLLVVGSHGASGFVYATIGSMAETLLRAAHSDVLVVRDRRGH
jgi:nucleotide-binding universal stress UspA family protein